VTAAPRAQLQPAEYADLAKRHLPDLWHVAAWVADDPSAAEDLVRDTLLAGARQYGDLGGDAEAKPWLLKLMCEAYHKGSIAGAAGSDGAPTATTASGDDLKRALRSLPARLRLPVLLSHAAGLSYSEIAQVLELPVGAVRARIAKGRLQLAPLGGSNCPVSSPAHDDSGE